MCLKDRPGPAAKPLERWVAVRAAASKRRFDHAVSRIELASALVWLTKLRRRCSSSIPMPNFAGSLAAMSTVACMSSKSCCERASGAASVAGGGAGSGGGGGGGGASVVRTRLELFDRGSQSYLELVCFGVVHLRR